MSWGVMDLPKTCNIVSDTRVHLGQEWIVRRFHVSQSVCKMTGLQICACSHLALYMPQIGQAMVQFSSARSLPVAGQKRCMLPMKVKISSYWSQVERLQSDQTRQKLAPHSLKYIYHGKPQHVYTCTYTCPWVYSSTRVRTRVPVKSS